MRRFVSFFILLLFSVQALALPEISVKKKINASVGKGLILSQIANFKGFTKNQIEKIGQINVLNTNDVAKKRHIVSAREISKKIHRALQTFSQETGVRPQLKIPARVFITYISPQLPEDKVKDKILKQVKDQCAECTFTVKGLRLPKLEGIQGSYQWRIPQDRKEIRGPFNIPVIVTDKSREKTFWVSGFLSIEREVPTLSRTLSARDRIQTQDIRYKKIDVTYHRKTVPTRKELKSARLKRHTISGHPIWQEDIVREKAVHAGEIVKVTDGNDVFEVSTMGRAKKGGFIGDVIQVVNKNSKKEIQGVIVAKGVIQVQ